MTDDARQHEENAKEFVVEIERVLMDGFRLSEAQVSTVFNSRNVLLARFRDLIDDAFWRGRRAAIERAKEQTRLKLDEIIR